MSLKEHKNLISELKEGKRLVEIFPPQDVKKGNMWYAVAINKSIVLLNSDKECFDINDDHSLNHAGITLTNKQVSKLMFSSNGIKRFVNEDTVDFNDVFNKIQRFIRTFIFLRDERFYTYIALWIMGTYFYMVFRYYPYIHVNAEKGSGKTTLMDVMSQLAFNAETVSNISGAGIFRLIDANGSSLFIDEFEGVDGRYNKDIIAILNTGFHKGGVVPRCEKKKDNFTSPKMYRTYSPKVFAGIEDIYNSLADRCIKITMMKNSKNEQISRFKVNENMEQYLSDLRDDLFILGLTLGPEIEEKYNDNFAAHLSALELQGRDMDLWEPIFLMAEQVDDSAAFETMERLAADTIKDRSIDNLINNLSHRVIIDLEKAIKLLQPMKSGEDVYYYRNTQLLDTLYDIDPGLQKYIGSITKLTQYLKNNLGIDSDSITVHGKTNRVYVIYDYTITDLKQRFVIFDDALSLNKNTGGQEEITELV